jgi:uncharacterized protein YecE (DUF72 family)
MARIYIGTSGWNYKHWIGTFYPSDLNQSEELQYYCKHFKTVELNNSFYHLPEAKSFTNWRQQTPADFLFAVKGSRFITHMKKLKVDKVTINKFLQRTTKLGEKLGTILFQLPPRWKVNVERLDQFLSRLPSGHRYTFEFRDHTWYTQEVYDVLRVHNCAFCIYELAGHTSPVEVTADFVYIRLHGPGDKYQGNYTSVALKKWASKCTAWTKDKKDVYIYFDNDQQGYAAFNAQQLQKIVKQK